MNGLVEHVAMANAFWSHEQFKKVLSGGSIFNTFRPDFYAPLVSDAVDIVGGAPLTVSGAVLKTATSPQPYRLGRRKRIYFLDGAPPVSPPPPPPPSALSRRRVSHASRVGTRQKVLTP